MTADLLADLLAEMTNAGDCRGDGEPYEGEDWEPEAEWLRANRDRVLAALGGECWIIGLTRTVHPTAATTWTFPKEQPADET